MFSSHSLYSYWYLKQLFVKLISSTYICGVLLKMQNEKRIGKNKIISVIVISTKNVSLWSLFLSDIYVCKMLYFGWFSSSGIHTKNILLWTSPCQVYIWKILLLYRTIFESSETLDLFTRKVGWFFSHIFPFIIFKLILSWKHE